MTDFLTRLAERTLGLAPIAQPLIPSRFATGQAPVGSYAFTTTMDEMSMEENIDAVETESRLNTMPTFSIKVSPTRTDPLVQPRATPLQDVGERGQAISTQDAGVQKRAGVLPSVAPAGPSEYPLSHLPQRENTWLKPSQEGNPANQEPLQLKVASSIRRDVDNELSPTGQRPLLAADIQHQKISLSQPHLTKPGQETAERAPVPEVRVTIGRIDVRAISPSSPGPTSASPTSARPRPALSLDDYLKQQRGGKR
jgi:hypothetical protein